MNDGIVQPPSLKNIFKELNADLGVEIPLSGNLERWAQQGVLLLNSVLTVEENKAAAHQKQGWEQFTDKIIETVNQECDHVVFILWGSYAQKKASFCRSKKTFGFRERAPVAVIFVSRFFWLKTIFKTNAWLKKQGLNSIKW